ncbi:cadherin domain-containing protein [Novosphingobium fuchskuhlense]|uniref:cadherin domain-containing protein n=1 Tax=Novosphingobium fuchskuhlense TaxID=1117702 RepID=UPI000AE40B80|nr:cadherin domain-containing protein [Novosphingobium fuchskuhlense]
MLVIDKVGAEFLVNTETAGNQIYSPITGLSNGGFVVAWANDIGFIKAQLFGDDGAKVGGEFLVNTHVAYPSQPSITSLVNGGFVVTWQAEDYTLGDSSHSCIAAQVFGADGAKVGSAFLVNTQTANYQEEPTITSLANGGFVVAWTDFSGTQGDGSGGVVKAQVFTADGTKFGRELGVSSEAPSSQSRPAIASLNNGGFVVTWQCGDGPVDFHNGYRIMAQIFGSDGTKIGGTLLVSPETKNSQLDPSIASLYNGGFVIVWDGIRDFQGSDVKAQLYDSKGFKIDKDFILTSDYTGFSPQVSGLKNGGFVVVMQGPYRNSDDILSQVFGEDGAKIGREFLVNSQTYSLQNSPRVTTLSNGGFAVSWNDYSGTLGDISGGSIKAQIFGVNTAPVIVSNGGAAAAAVSIAENTTTVTTVTATDPDAGTTLTYSISGGAHASLFSIDASTGALAFKAAPNFETPADAGGNNVYDVIVQVSDGSLTDTQAISVAVTNVNEFPPLITSNGGGASAFLTISENNTAVTAVAASDADAGARIHYGIVGGADASLFKISRSTGVLTFKSAPDFETPTDAGHDNVYDVVLQASDGSRTDQQAISVSVSDVVNELLVGTSHADNLTGAGGSDTLKGCAGDDTLIGGGGNDLLDGGKGADHMDGGAGNDTYIVDNAGDVVVEKAGNGIDTIKAIVSLALWGNVENLTFTGTADLSARGNDLANTIVGNSGSNALFGGSGADALKGGAGNDTLSGGEGKDALTGGAGQDFFVFDTTPGAANVDKITDFSFGDGDKIQISQSVFAGFTHLGALAAGEFYSAAGATSAHDASDRVIYDTTTGKLYYDADGQGGAAAVQIAVLGSSTHPILIYSDLQIIA